MTYTGAGDSHTMTADDTNEFPEQPVEVTVSPADTPSQPILVDTRCVFAQAAICALTGCSSSARCYL